LKDKYAAATHGRKAFSPKGAQHDAALCTADGVVHLKSRVGKGWKRGMRLLCFSTYFDTLKTLFISCLLNIENLAKVSV
jgi:hypothetical protein